MSELDMSPVITPKSDQISADDFIAGPRTYQIEGVAISPGTEQPVQIKLVGEARVWKPCKSMSRVLVAGWGPDAKLYQGRGITLYRDPKVKWGGMEVGGIRVSHMSHLERELLIQLTATKGKRAPHIVKPLVAEVKQHPSSEDGAAKWANVYIAKVRACLSDEELQSLSNAQRNRLNEMEAKRPELFKQIEEATAEQAQSFIAGKPDSEMGEGFTSADGEWAE
jgi:hypothetical protein